MQTEDIPLPEAEDGTERWVTVRRVTDIVSGDRKAVRRAISIDIGEDGTSHLNAGVADDMREALLARIITGWSFDLPLPVADPASLDKLPLDAYDALIEATEVHFKAVDFRKQASKNGGTSSA